MHSTDPARRFLNAFHRIEQLLRQRSGANDNVRFYELVDRTKSINPEQRRRLKELADLRNVIVHHPYSDENEPYATPRDETVRWIEAQVDIIQKPPVVLLALKLQPPVVLSGADRLLEFLDIVGAPNNFSQSPYWQANGELGLITTNAVARWLAMQHAGDGFISGDVSIDQVVAAGAESRDRVLVKNRTLRVVDALLLFSGDRKNEPPSAILMTETGSPREKPLGLITPSDIPAMTTLLGV